MGKDSVAYMDQAPVPPDDGEILAGPFSFRIGVANQA